MITALMRSGFLSDVASTLIVSTDPERHQTLSETLSGKGFEIQNAGSLKDAEQIVMERLLELVLLDYSSDPEVTVKFCRRIRRDPQTCGMTVVFVGSAVNERDIVKVLWVGADEFIELPADTAVLVARLKSLMRRHAAGACHHDHAHLTTPTTSRPRRRFRIGDLHIDPQRYQAYFRSKRLDLTVGEFRILFALAERPGQVLSRETLVQAMHGHESGVNDRAMDSRIYSIRKRLGECGDYIETVYGVGYRLKTPG